MHKSQGFGAAQTRGGELNYFQHTAGDSAAADLFDGVDLSWSRVKGGERVGALLEEAISAFKPEDPPGILPILLNAYAEMSTLPEDAWTNLKRAEIIEVIKACAGLWMEAIASDSSVIPGGDVRVALSALNRSRVPVTLERIALSYGAQDSLIGVPLLYNEPMLIRRTIHLPDDAGITGPYWIAEQPNQGFYRVENRALIGLPENPPALTARFIVSIGGKKLGLSAPVAYRWVDPVEGEMYRPCEIVPSVSANLDEKVYVFSGTGAKNIGVRIHCNSPGESGHVRLIVPSGWLVEPATSPFTLRNKNDEQTLTFSARPSGEYTQKNVSASVLAEVETNHGKGSLGAYTVHYPHIPRQTVFRRSEGKMITLELKTGKRAIGYIMGSGDAVPMALRQMGYSVTLLSDEDLARGDLQVFQTIISGVRAYNTRPHLKMVQTRLLEYVKSGGTYIVQYVVPEKPWTENLGPYGFEVSRDRVTLEDAPVTFTDPRHPLLNEPNTITQEDFQGWVQERGLSFADAWDSSYQTVLSCSDPGERSHAGGLLAAQYGHGWYIYTGYSFFRQLPAGVPGAYRLFANMVEIKSKGKQ